MPREPTASKIEPAPPKLDMLDRSDLKRKARAIEPNDHDLSKEDEDDLVDHITDAVEEWVSEAPWWGRFVLKRLPLDDLVLYLVKKIEDFLVELIDRLRP